MRALRFEGEFEWEPAVAAVAGRTEVAVAVESCQRGCHQRRSVWPRYWKDSHSQEASPKEHAVVEPVEDLGGRRKGWRSH